MAKKVFVAGQPKPANSGRKKGTPNKRTVEEKERYDFIMDLVEQRMMEAEDVVNSLSPQRAAELYFNLLGFKKAKLSATRIDGNLNTNDKRTLTIQYVNQIPENPDQDNTNDVISID